MPSQEGQEVKQVWRSGLGDAHNKVGGEEGVRVQRALSGEPLRCSVSSGALWHSAEQQGTFGIRVRFH